MNKEKGIVAYINDDKGYGFVEVEGREKSVFFHSRDVKHIRFEKLRKGDTLEVEGIVETDKGFNATAVYLIS